VSSLRRSRKYKQSHTALYYITQLQVSTHYSGHHQVAAHLEVGMFTTTKDRRIILYNKKMIHILLCAVRVFIDKSLLSKTYGYLIIHGTG
jgi:hypothetical protein